MPNIGLFLFIFILFKHNFTEKTVDFNRIWTRMAGVEGENADHLTTTTPAPPRAQLHCSVISWSLVSFKTWGRWKNRFVFEIGKKDEKAWKCRNEKTSILERRPIRRKRGKSRPFQSGKSDTLFTIISAKSWRQDFDFSCLQMDQCHQRAMD